MENKRPLILSDVEAKRIYKTASPELKIMLEDTFGKKFFSQSITEHIKTYEDACAELGIVPIDEAALLYHGFTRDEIAYQKLKIIVRALNEGWEPDWKNQNQYKYYPYFYYTSSDASVACANAYNAPSTARTSIGSRLCLKSRELAIFAGNQFIELYKEFIL